MKIVQLVDNIDYVRSNCFQHQLAIALSRECDLQQVEMSRIGPGIALPEADGYISCLKQRTLMRQARQVGSWLHGAPLVVYDQDPWHSYMDDSEFKGAYDVIMQHVNVRSFALTTQWWVDMLNSRGVKSNFVRMWVLPEYVVPRPSYQSRSALVGFIGSVHPRRKQILDLIEASGIKTTVKATSSLGYSSFLEKLSELKIFVHNEDLLICVDGQELNFNTGMWVKDVEAASQGCFSIRSQAQGSETYLTGLENVMLYEHIEDVPDIIRSIEALDPLERQAMIDRSVERIRSENVWKSTAQTLIELACR